MTQLQTLGEWSESVTQHLRSKPVNSQVAAVPPASAHTVTPVLTTSLFPDLTSPVHSVSLTGMEPTVPPRPTGSALEQTDSTTSTVQPAATHVVPLVTTMLTKPPHTSGVVLHLVQDIMDAWPPLVEPPTR